MQEYGKKNPSAQLADLGLEVATAHWNLSPEVLVQQTVERKQGELSDTGALCVQTGKFTGRSPKDKFVVKDQTTEKTVDWGDINIPTTPEIFDALYNKVCQYLQGKEVWVRDAYACADPKYRLNIRVVNEDPWANLFCHHLFLRPTESELASQQPDWLILQAPSFLADPAVDGTRQGNFTMVNFTRRIILIGGSAYTGEIKKGIFSVLNYLLPQEHQVLSMHCSANEGKAGDVALFFGLSGTGKTTLSADPNRALIGDDEHGWAEGSVFNFEGGCYAKVIDLSEEKEPQIFQAIKDTTILENTTFVPGTRKVDFASTEITENTRAAYPIYYIPNAKEPSYGGDPKNIFFLTCDAFGVLPPISRLSVEQAMYQFISGYTAKVAGTETGITEPKSTFSACFGAPFIPLHPGKYAEMLKERLIKHKTKVWLVNTGWTGGSYGTGSRIKLEYTRALIKAALRGDLDNVQYTNLPLFNLSMPVECPGVPSEILNPENTWEDKAAYREKLSFLAGLFRNNFKKYEEGVEASVIQAGPSEA